ncbi:MAG TPA: cupin domain-containing protein [Dehalococcoidia bacterium]|nr:cupin domain-containing protein [Dehalococcoidia bacterium]
MSEVIALAEKLQQIAEHWHPRTVARLDGYLVKLAKVQGEFVWHTHDDQDKLFLVLEGDLTIQLRHGEVLLRPGDLYVVPRGVEHCPTAENEVSLLLIEREDTKHTGEVVSEKTVAEHDWI